MPTQPHMDWLNLTGLVVQALIFVVGVLILPTIKAMKTAVEKNNEELHKMQIGLVKLETQMTGMETLRQNEHTLRDMMHTLQLQMARHGLLREPAQVREEEQ